jgi:hypothetical protein
MKKSYGYMPRNRVTNHAAPGQALSGRNSMKSGAAVQSVRPTNSQSALTVDDIDRQLIRFFKEHE